MAIDYRNAYPYWYYKYIALAERGASLGSQYIIWKLESGYDYWIRGLLISYPHYTDVVNPDDVSPPLFITLVQTERNRRITEIPIPTEICANPGGNQPGTQPQPVKPLFNGYIRWDYILSNSDVLNLKIEGQAGGHPEYCRLAVVGHNVRAGNHV